MDYIKKGKLKKDYLISMSMIFLSCSILALFLTLVLAMYTNPPQTDLIYILLETIKVFLGIIPKLAIILIALTLIIHFKFRFAKQ